MRQIKKRRTHIGLVRTVTAGIMSLALCIMPTAVSAVTARSATEEQAAFAQAANEFRVPEELLMAVSYYQTRFEPHTGQMSSDGGFGPMDLRGLIHVQDGRGDPARPVDTTKTVIPAGGLTLTQAASLLHVPEGTLKTDVTQNIRGGAAVLAAEAKQLNNGQLPTSTRDWLPAAAHFAGINSSQAMQSFIDDMQGILQRGITVTTSTGQQLYTQSLPTLALPTITNTLHVLGIAQPNQADQYSSNGTDCPQTLNCRFVPAAYAANSSDPTDYGNYDHANRPKDMKINYIVIHDTEGSYDSAIAHFQDTHAYVSANYVIRSSDGAVTQMVRTSDVAWHAGDWYVNMHSIGIEHEGYAAIGGSWYTEAMYRSSAALVRYLANRYHIPLDRNHIIGHENVPGLNDARAAVMHWDPGPYWDWNHYMDLVQGKTTASHLQPQYGNIVTINPKFATNVQTVSVCTTNTSCVDQTAPSDFVYLRTAPRTDAPFITDPLLHPGGEPGSTRIDDWTAKATTGQQYAVADRQGDWTAIWFANQEAWFYNPASQPTATFHTGKTVTLRPGLATTHMFGGAYPETSVYPSDVHYPQQPQLSYTISAGQSYVADMTNTPTDYFYDWTINSSAPYDHDVFKGNEKYIKIWYNHRVMYVKANDVILQ